MGHVSLFNLLYSYFLVILFMESQLDETKLALAQGLIKFVELTYICGLHGLLKFFRPLFNLIS